MFEFFDRLSENSEKQLDKVSQIDFMLSDCFTSLIIDLRLLIFNDIKTNAKNSKSAYVFALEIGSIIDLYRMYNLSPYYWNKDFVDRKIRQIGLYGISISETITDENIEYLSMILNKYKL